MSQQNEALAKLHEGHNPASLKSKAGVVVSSHWFELIIILCIFADVGLVFMEMGIDQHFFCIGGKKVAVSREELGELAEEGGKEGEKPPVHLLAMGAPLEEGWYRGVGELLLPPKRRGLAFLQRERDWREHPAPKGEAAAPEKEAAAPKREALVPYTKFKPACVGHVQRLVSRNDRSHTDVHLDRELLHQCELEKEFPLTSQDGFEDAGACREFASMLVAARDASLKDGSPRPYEDFCGLFYVHKGGKIPEGETPISEDPEWGVDPTDVHPPGQVPAKREAQELEGEGGKGEEAEEEGGEEEEEAEAALVCEDRHGHHAHHMAHICHFWSVAILCFFMLELLVKIWINPSAFFGNFFHVLDLIVVSVSLFIDTVMVTVVMWIWGASSEGLDIVSLLLLISRLWRIARIVHGVFEVALSQKEELDELQNEISESKEANEKLEEKIKRLESRTG